MQLPSESSTLLGLLYPEDGGRWHLLGTVSDNLQANRAELPKSLGIL